MDIKTKLYSAQDEEQRLWTEMLKLEEQAKPFNDKVKAARTEWCNARRRFEMFEMMAKEMEPEKDEPVIYQRGELPPGDARDEHDKSL